MSELAKICMQCWFISALVFYVFGRVDDALFFMVASIGARQFINRKASHD